MTYAEDVVRRRSGRLSSHNLAVRAQLTPGRVWAIEHGRGRPPSDAERAALDRVLTEIENEPPTTRSTAAARRVTRSSTVTTTASAAPVPRPPSLSRAAVGVDWSSLRRVADTVSDHDFERVTEGPDPTAGYRLFSNSEINTFTQCPRRWWLAYWRGLTPRHESPLGPLAIGDRVHRALRHYYVPSSAPAVDPRESIERLIKSDWAKVERQYDAGDPQLTALRTKFVEESDLERVMLDGYVEWLIATGVDENLEIIGSEMYAECEFTDHESDTPVKLIGKLDARARRTTDGAHLFLDHKTVANITTPRATLHMNPQMLHYHLIMSALTQGDERCSGALYNMLRKTYRSSRARPPFYDRVEVRHNDHVLRSYRRRLAVIIQMILSIEDKLRDGADFQDIIHHNPTDRCTWGCQFFAVCPMFDDGASHPEAMMDEYYRKHDVLDYYFTESFTE